MDNEDSDQTARFFSPFLLHKCVFLTKMLIISHSTCIGNIAYITPDKGGRGWVIKINIFSAFSAKNM